MKKWSSVLNTTVLVSALGYFVDMFDITLFGAVRGPSLLALGITDLQQTLEISVRLYNWQMGGMLIGGLIWGIIGDKVGRASVLYGSILMYSVANIANAFVQTVPQYELARFVAGIGLAGELGAAITLVSEVLSKEDRGYGTTFVATLGMLGGAAAALTGKYLPWNYAYILGGILGLLLLVARIKSFESEMFKKFKTQKVKMGNWKLLLVPHRALKYFCMVALGIPIYFITAILLTLAPELTHELKLQSAVTAPDALIYGTLGLALGDLLTGLSSQLLKSRKKSVGLSLLLALGLMFLYLNANGATAFYIYSLCFGLGICAGYWAVLITTAAEHFGADIRATVATSVPNFVRGTGMIMASSFVALRAHYTSLQTVLILGLSVFGIALLALWMLEETYGKNLDFIEEAS